MAPAMRAVNAPFVVPEFGKLPAFRMPEVFDQIVRAIVWTYRTLVVDQGKAGIVVSGHSSGAHMAARIASHDFGDEMPASTLRAVLCVSGAYDLEPVMLSARRIYIDLSEREQRFMSPIARISETKVPVHLFYGSEESPEFKRQSIAYADALRGQGKLACCTEIAGANHFEIASQMAQSDQTVGRAVAGLLSEESRKTAK
ncbi:arylformamidase [Roseivivax lentus]|uniref:Arylformamidase n=2 Tax=Roseivivax lentus TaxID=633194 RepID=A0A1N7P4E4_9RHOB|nr:arylformamidase [Roseivivax lentus]